MRILALSGRLPPVRGPVKTTGWRVLVPTTRHSLDEKRAVTDTCDDL